MPVLKAAGCDDVVYVTRKGGDAQFSQEIGKRVFRQEGVNWDVMWKKMYDLSNPMSSFSKSLSEATAVVCTDWDAFTLPDGWDAMIKDGYQAPIYSAKWLTQTPFANPRVIRTTDNTLNRSTGVYSYAGCIPQP
ncbi:MAG: hypothetical protein EOP09_16915 [Proteobacteria bacterium]|nr:MAG: hypothetical protein EOP09_16915 [Pseudomonadota bacterium]